MHVLITGDNRDLLKNSVNADIDRIRSTTKTISHIIGAKHSCKVLPSNKLSPKAILRAIKNAKVKSRDIVLFYFSGHGNRPIKRSRWPTIYFSKRKKHLDLAQVIASIKKKRPRLSLILCDACNRSTAIAKSHQNEPNPRSRIPIDDKIQANVKLLFTQSKGTIIACGARPGEVAWSCKNGGLFTGMFFNQLSDEVQRSSPSWKHLLTSTKKACSHIQKPITKMKLTSLS